MYLAGENIIDIQSKLKSIKTAIVKERRKLIASMKSGTETESVYIPILSWYSTVDSFLQPYVGIGNLKDNLDTSKYLSFNTDY